MPSADSNSWRNLWLLIALVAAALSLPFLCGEGMFFDGLTYAAISRNLAQGRGTFWSPYYMQTIFPIFHEHPPLLFGLQGLVFKVFGDSQYVEKWCSFFCFLGTMVLMVQLVRLFTANRLIPGLAVLFWLSFTTVGYAYANNVLDIYMAFFCLAAVIFQIKAIQNPKNFHMLMYFLLSMVFIYAGFLTKGLVALYVLATPALYLIVPQTSKVKDNKFTGKLIKLALANFIIFAHIFGLLWNILPEFQILMKDYLSTQVGAAILGTRSNLTTVWGRAELLVNLNECLSPAFYLCVFLALVSRKFMMKDQVTKKYGLFFLAMGLISSLPMMVAHKFNDIYLPPCLPYYAISFAFFAVYVIDLARFRQPLVKYATAISLVLILGIFGVCGYSLTLIGKPIRDKEFVGLTKYLRENQVTSPVIYTCLKERKNARLTAYLHRFNQIELSEFLPASIPDHTLYLQTKRCGSLDERHWIKTYSYGSWDFYQYQSH